MTIPRARGGRPRVRKITVSLSTRATEAAYADMAERGVPTISAYLDRLVVERAEERTLRAIVDDLLGDRAPTPDERAWAEAAFRA